MWTSQNHPERQLRLSKASRTPVPRRRRFQPRLEGLEDRMVPSTLTVTNTLDKGAGSLRGTITKAKDGDTIVFDPGLNGQTITLTSDQLTINKSLDIEGPGPSLLAISGNDANRVFNINEGLTVTIAGLTITHGRGGGGGGESDSAGGGILNVDSSLMLANDVLSYNTAHNTGVSAGGAVANRTGGSLTVTGCTFVGNRATAGVIAEGGAIANTLKGSMLTVTNSTFLSNQAVGISGGQAGGGAIENDGDVGGATASISGSSFTNNTAIGGDGGVVSNTNTEVGIAFGGAIDNSGALTISNTMFTGNKAIGGNGGSGGKGAGFYTVDIANGGAIESFNAATLNVDSSSFSGNKAIAGSNARGGSSGLGRIGIASGGAITNLSMATITNSTFSNNAARGGNGNTSLTGDSFVGEGIGGGLSSNPFNGVTATSSISGCTFTNNQAMGGNGNTGGSLSSDGAGGGLLLRLGAAATVANTTFSGNQAIGGQDASGNGADGLGGGLANIVGSSLTVSGCTLSGNSATGGAGGSGANGGNGFGGGAYNDGQSTLTILGSTITMNQAVGGAAGVGGIAGLGEGGGLYLAPGGVACLDAFTQAHTKNNHATSDHDDIFGSFTTC